MALWTPDRRGQMADVVLGFDDPVGYLGPHPYFGALIGRYGNRIAQGRFEMNGRDIRLARNNGPNHLHGGERGFDKVIWSDEVEATGKTTLRLTYVSDDGEEGYPGRLTTQVTYEVTENELLISYRATTDQPTVVNLTQHSYFNLAGHDQGDVLGHELFIDADRFTPIDEELIPTGELASVEGTSFDFRTPTRVGARLGSGQGALPGYDHNFVLNQSSREPRLAARVFEPGCGRQMEVLTTEPGLQLYTGQGLDGSLRGKGGAAYASFAGLCLETQHFPDSPNRPHFPSTRLDPGGEYKTKTIYRFSHAPG